MVEVTSNDDAITWDQYVLEQPQARSYHLMGWRRVIEGAFGHRTWYLMVKDADGNARGVLPLVFFSSRMFGRFLVSMPFFNYGGVLTDTLEAAKLLLDAAVALARGLQAEHIELRQQEVLHSGWPSKQHKVSMRLGLPSEYEILWKTFPPKLRSQIRRAQKAGMSVRMGGREILEDFYRVFSRNMWDLGTPVYERIFFDKIVEVFPKDTRVCVVYLRDHPVAAGLLYGFRTMLEIPWASSDRRYNHLASNMLLYSKVLDYACKEKFQVLDFGRSTPGAGTYRFKEQWGARPVPLSWAYWAPTANQLPDISPKNPRYELPIRIWKRLPLVVANRLGPLIARSIP